MLLASVLPLAELDPVEPCLPVGPTFELVGTTLNIVGTAGNDIVTGQVNPAGQLVINVNEVGYSIPSSLVAHISIDVHCGDDSITLRPSVIQTSGIAAGTGNDSVSIGGGASRISGGTGNDRLSGGPHGDGIGGGSGRDFIAGNGGATAIPFLRERATTSCVEC
jgi:Ca2+-binding RTX toxin-like protein